MCIVSYMYRIILYVAFYVGEANDRREHKKLKGQKFVASSLAAVERPTTGVAGGENILLSLNTITSFASLLTGCLLFRYPSYPGGMDGIPLGIGVGGSMDPLEAILGPFPCVRLRNLPLEATLEDVLVFFQGLVVLDVILQGNGEAFVVFANPMDFQMALQRYVHDSLSVSRLARS